MFKGKIATIMLLIFAALSTHAQNRMADGNIVGPGGNNNSNGAPVLSENIGADLYTGKLTAGFKLFNYKSKSSGLSHSISINYDGGGNQVDAIASNLGANWSLNTGGYIYREIKGVPDETQPGFTSSATAVSPISGLDSVTLMQYVTDRRDGQFDIYSFNAGETNGRFIIGKTGEIQTIPRMNITIEKISWTAPFGGQMDSCNRQGFIITLENGTKYLFSDFDCQLINYYNGDAPYHTSSTWYLTSIISGFGNDTINLNYQPTIGDEWQPTHDYYGYINNSLGQPAAVDEFTGDIPPTIRVRKMIIDHINYPDGTTVTFNYLYNRLDCKTEKALNAIEIARGGDQYGYQFKHSYMNRSYNGQPVQTVDLPFDDYEHTNPSLWNSANVETLYSLQLDSFYKHSNQKALAGYGFKYHPTCLPPIGSDRGIDLWGYFNGTNDDRKTQYFDGSTMFYASLRAANIQYAQAKSLQKINLPTGGVIKFSYELHSTKSSVIPNDMGVQSVNGVGGLRIKQIVYSDAIGQVNDMVKTYQYTEADGITSSGVMANFPRFGYLYNEYCNPNAIQNFDYNLAWAISYNHYGNSGTPIPSYTNNTFLIRNGQPLNCLLYTHGAIVGYGRVTEYAGTLNKNTGKVVYYYTTANDYPVSNSLLNNEFPYPYIPDNDFAWGLPTSIENYNGAGLLLSKKQTEYAVYSFELNNDAFRSLKIGLKTHPPHNLSDYAYKYYYPTSGKVFMTKQTNVKYYANNKSLRDSIVYSYDTAHNVLRYSIVTNANDEPIKTLYYYPFDFSNTLPAIKALQVNNADRAFAVRIEKWNMAPATPRLLDVSAVIVDTVNGVFYTSNGKTKYKGLVKPKASYEFTPSQPVNAAMWGSFNPSILLPNLGYFTLTTTMDKYDSKGNLLQTTVKGSVSSAVFDKPGIHLIAAVANGNYTDIAYTSFEDNSTGSWIENGIVPTNPTLPDHFLTGVSGYAMLQNNLNRSNLNANLKYTISLWSFSGNPKLSATVNGNVVTIPLVNTESHNGWQLWKAEVSGATGVRVSSGSSTTVIDELRLYPSSATMSTTTYAPLFGPTSICDASNHTAYNVFDELGRISFGKDADGNIRKAINYKQQEQQY